MENMDNKDLIYLYYVNVFWEVPNKQFNLGDCSVMDIGSPYAAWGIKAFCRPPSTLTH